MDSDLLLFVGLGAAFAAVGVHVVLHARRQSALMRRFARSRGLAVRTQDSELESELNDAFALEEPGLARAFDRLRDVIPLSGAALFRCIELLDLSPHGTPQTTHHRRTAVAFRAPARAPDGIFLVLPEGSVRRRHPRGRPAEPGLEPLLREAGAWPPPRPLSITLRSGRGLAYLEPLVAGRTTEEDLADLARLGEGLAQLAERRA